MSSHAPSERRRGLPLESLAEDLATTAADLAALRHARRSRLAAPLTRLELLAPPAWLPRTARRRTAEGWEPFEL
jgi:hypothetical protein